TTACLDVQQQTLRIFQRFFHGYQTQNGFAAVNDAVVVGHSQVVHGANHDLTIFHNSAILGGVNAQDGGLRWVDDGSGQHGAEHTTVGDGEGTACHFFQGQLAIASTGTEVSDLLFDVSDGHLISVTQDRHHQTAWATNGHTDIEVTVVDDVFAINRGVQHGVFLQGGNSSLDEEGHEAQFHAVLFLELILVLLAQIQHRLHVHFVERGQHGVFGLRLQQTLGDTSAQAAHGHALFWTTVQGQGWRGNRSGSRFGSSGVGFQSVTLGDATTTARAFHGAGFHTLFSQDLGSCRRSNRRGGGAGSRSCSGWGSSRSGFFSSGGRSSSASLAFGVDTGQHVAGGNSAAVGLDDFA